MKLLIIFFLLSSVAYSQDNKTMFRKYQDSAWHYNKLKNYTKERAMTDSMWKYPYDARDTTLFKPKKITK